MGEPAEVLLGARAGRADGAAMHRRLLLRLRVHGAQRAPGHHPAHRPHLPHPHTGATLKGIALASCYTLTSHILVLLSLPAVSQCLNSVVISFLPHFLKDNVEGIHR